MVADMRLWQFVLDRDRAFDLTSDERGRAWAAPRAVGWWPRPDFPAKDPNWFDLWARNVRALRSLAARLARAKTRPPAIEPAEADQILEAYLSRLAVRVVRVRPPQRRRKSPKLPPSATVSEIVDAMPDFGASVAPLTPLTRKTFAGLTLEAGGSSEDGPGRHDQYWQDVFLSLVGDQFTAPVCGSCGSPLPPSAKGRTSRRENCAACRSKLHRERAKADPARLEELRRKWREQRARHRESEKAKE
jgi:hypothetical protein